MLSLLGPLLILIAGVVAGASGGIVTSLSAGSSPQSASLIVSECIGCTGGDVDPWMIAGSCATITVTGNFQMGSGSCQGHSSPCTANPCTWADDVTITIHNSCGGPLYIKDVVNGACEAATKVIDAGAEDKWEIQGGEKLACGQSRAVRIWALYRPTSCTSGMIGGWSYDCSGCGLAH